jgi:hypothetical protein
MILEREGFSLEMQAGKVQPLVMEPTSVAATTETEMKGERLARPTQHTQ